VKAAVFAVFLTDAGQAGEGRRAHSVLRGVFRRWEQDLFREIARDRTHVKARSQSG